MSERTGIFQGADPFEIARSWLAEATETEINDPNAMAMATVAAAPASHFEILIIQTLPAN